jgi:pre-mRNA cleavage complex 2 protein Pcf11
MTTNQDNEVYRLFKESIFSDLTSNLKPVISSLTMIADDYKNNSREIVRAVEEYIEQVPVELKLCGLYVMDSIIKNLKETNYIQIFQENISKIFANVFESVS